MRSLERVAYGVREKKKTVKLHFEHFFFLSILIEVMTRRPVEVG